VEIEWTQVPLIDGVRDLAAQGMVTGASGRNWAAYGHEVALPEDFSTTHRALLSDPQTSGGLMVSCTPQSVDAVMEIFKRHGFDAARQIGRIAPAGSAKESVGLRVF
jgi:selenide,water dikinase